MSMSKDTARVNRWSTVARLRLAISARSVLPLLTGRGFENRDVKNNSVAVITESFAKAYLGKGNPLGRQIRLGMGDFKGVPWCTVVGVMANLRQTTLEEKPRPEVFRPYWPGGNGDMHLAIRFHGSAGKVAASTRGILHNMDPALSLDDVHTMGERIAEANAKRRFQTVLLTGFAGLAVLLACIGLYGLMTYSVKQRTAEVGVRMALGGSQAQVLRMVLRQGVGMVAIGLLIGIAVALGTTRLISGWLYGVSETDPTTFLSVAALLLAVAICASLIPAVAATRVDPVAALRHE
jgi:putative ABC transport system permease protein